MRAVATFLLTLIIAALCATTGRTTPVASAHRTHSIEYVEGRMRTFIRDRQCKGDIFWHCDQTMTPFAIPFGQHSWRWDGDYYFRSFGGDTAICHTSGVFTDHTILWPDGQVLQQGVQFFMTRKSGPHC